MGSASSAQKDAGSQNHLFYYKVGVTGKTQTLRITESMSIADVKKFLSESQGTHVFNLLFKDDKGNQIYLTANDLCNSASSPLVLEVVRPKKKVAAEETPEPEAVEGLAPANLSANWQAESVSAAAFANLASKVDGPRPFPQCTFTEEKLESLKTISFNLWECSEEELIALVFHIYNDLNLLEDMKIEKSTIEQFILQTRESYRGNPFHNFNHAFSVLQMMYGLMHVLKLKEVFTPDEKLCLTIAALCHDMDHPGYSNSYMINAKTKIAALYNDRSPLENHHAFKCCETMNTPMCTILQNQTPESYRFLRSTIIGLILATDMVNHSQYVDDWKQIHNFFDPESEEHRHVLMKLLIKCCDVSNEIRPKEVSDKWLERLLTEYFQQGDKEKEMSLPTLPFMDRDKTTPASAQIGFIKFVLIPLYMTLTPAFGEIVNEKIIAPLKDSLERFTKLKAEA